ncbi:hypothetical protein A9Q83_04305 [Alphaproteobacteria bacterium 46_93_T64]|nr:hypothetical protein A9Q83_04305 [Alphaproteobacteria bacterium 46_93_T64]
MSNQLRSLIAAKQEIEQEGPSGIMKAARDIIRIERNYFYSDRTSNKKLKEIRDVIQNIRID